MLPICFFGKFNKTFCRLLGFLVSRYPWDSKNVCLWFENRSDVLLNSLSILSVVNLIGPFVCFPVRLYGIFPGCWGYCLVDCDSSVMVFNYLCFVLGFASLKFWYWGICRYARLITIVLLWFQIWTWFCHVCWWRGEGSYLILFFGVNQIIKYVYFNLTNRSHLRNKSRRDWLLLVTGMNPSKLYFFIYL